MDEAPQPTPAAPRKPWYRSVTISLSAFVMSGTATLISAFHALQGAEIDIRPQDQIAIYRNADGQAPVLTVVLSLDAINDSADHGDVILGASLRINGDDAALPFDGTARFVPGSDVAKCTFGASCVPVRGFLVETTPDTMVELPKGAARTVTLSFPMDVTACKGARCSRYANFDDALKAINGRSVVFTIGIKLHDDGERTIECRTNRLDLSYLQQAGFTSPDCVESKVSGATFL